MGARKIDDKMPGAVGGKSVKEAERVTGDPVVTIGRLWERRRTGVKVGMSVIEVCNMIA
jgi:hypothetical protein